MEDKPLARLSGPALALQQGNFGQRRWMLETSCWGNSMCENQIQLRSEHSEQVALPPSQRWNCCGAGVVTLCLLPAPLAKVI